MCNIIYGMCCLQVLFDGLANSKYSMPISLQALIDSNSLWTVCTVHVYCSCVRVLDKDLLFVLGNIMNHKSTLQFNDVPVSSKAKAIITEFLEDAYDDPLPLPPPYLPSPLFISVFHSPPPTIAILLFSSFSLFLFLFTSFSFSLNHSSLSSISFSLILSSSLSHFIFTFLHYYSLSLSLPLALRG